MHVIKHAPCADTEDSRLTAEREIVSFEDLGGISEPVDGMVRSHALHCCHNLRLYDSLLFM